MSRNELSHNFELTTGLNFNKFYTSYRPKLVWYLNKYTQDQSVSDDFADDAFIQALQKIDMFDGSKSQIHTWVYKIAENLVRKEFKDNSKYDMLSMDKINDDTNLTLGGTISNCLVDDFNVEEDLVLLKKSDLVKEAIYKLPPKYRNIMVKREIECMSYTDIAENVTNEEIINVYNDTLNLKSVSDIIELDIFNLSNEDSYINITFNDSDRIETIQFDIKPYSSFRINKDDIENMLGIEIITNGQISGNYKTMTNLSTVKSQILKGRSLIRQMVSKKFRILDEQGII